MDFYGFAGVNVQAWKILWVCWIDDRMCGFCFGLDLSLCLWLGLVDGGGKLRKIDWGNWEDREKYELREEEEEEGGGGGGGGGERKRRKRKKKNGKNKEKVFSMCVKVGGPYGRCEIIIKNVRKILFK